MPPVSIRLGTPADAQAYRALLDALFSEGLNTIVPRTSAATLEQIHRFIAAHDGNQSALFLAFQGEALIGSLNLTQHTRPETQHVAPLGLNVVAYARGAGVGKSLIAAALDWVDAGGIIDRVELEVLENNAPAIRLYEQFRFVREGRKRHAVKRESEFIASLIYARITPARGYAG